jgi:tetratricopeptide (TPR) repeat protein
MMRSGVSKHALLCAALGFIFLWAGALPAIGQEGLGKGRISGTVIDEQGNPIEGVAIVMVNAYNTKLEGQSDKEGHFAVAGMGTGMWNLTATKDGFEPATQQIDVRQLRRNPPIEIVMKRLTGNEAFLSDDEAMELFNEADGLMKEEQYDAAILMFQDLLEKHPDLYQTHLSIGNCYMKKGDLDEAESEFSLVLEKIKEVYGDYHQDKKAALGAFAGLGTLALQKDDFQTAKDYFTQSLELSPEDPAAAYNVGSIFFSNQRIEESIEYLELAKKIDSSWPDPYLKLGYVYLNIADYDRSLEHFNKFIEMDPENPEVPVVRQMIETISRLKK